MLIQVKNNLSLLPVLEKDDSIKIAVKWSSLEISNSF